jgi:hypothetical protein
MQGIAKRPEKLCRAWENGQKAMQSIGKMARKGYAGHSQMARKGYAHGQKSYAGHRKMARKAMQGIAKWPEKLCRA